jgi:hypothetical protein
MLISFEQQQWGTGNFQLQGSIELGSYSYAVYMGGARGLGCHHHFPHFKVDQLHNAAVLVLVAEC